VLNLQRKIIVIKLQRGLKIRQQSGKFVHLHILIDIILNNESHKAFSDTIFSIVFDIFISHRGE